MQSKEILALSNTVTHIDRDLLLKVVHISHNTLL